MIFTGYLKIIEKGIEQPYMCCGCLSCKNDSIFGGIKKVNEVRILVDTKLNLLFLSQELVDIPIAHYLYLIFGGMKEQNKKYNTCPFDNNHIIDSNKFQKHLLKCKAPNRKQYQQCKHNHLHWLHFTEICKHEEKCAYNQKIGKKNPSFESFQVSSILKSSDLSSIHDITENNIPTEKSILMDHFLEGVKKEEKMSKNRDGLWKEPNFGEWFDTNIKKQVNKPGNFLINNRAIGIDFNDSF